MCLCALGVLIGGVSSAAASMYFGATISGETYGHPDDSHAPEDTAAWALFERHAGRKVAVLNQGQNWLTFDKAAMDATRARGAIPMVTMGLPGGMTLAGVVDGSQDAAIRKWAQDAKAWGSPFFLNLWWEMNGNWYSWGRSADFIAAWRRFHDLVSAEGATNVTWTWTVNSVWSDPLSDPTPYYPGDAYVDWVALDSYNWGRSPVQSDKWITPEQTLTPTLEVLRQVAPTKPVAIVENASTEYGGNKGAWIREMLTTYLPRHPEIKAYLWFNWNFPKNGLRSDWPIESSPPAQLQFRKGIQSSVFVPGPVSLPALAKVPPPTLAAGPAQPADLSAAAEMAAGPDLAVAPDGTATVVWSARSAGGELGVFARRVAPDGTRGPIHQLTAPSPSPPARDALTPQVAVAPDGTATVVWARSDGSDLRVETRKIAPGGAPAAETRVLSGAGQDALAPQVDVSPSGVATVAWQRFDGSNYLVQAKRIKADGTSPDPAQRLSAQGQYAVEPQLDVAPDGTATVVWSRFDGSDSIVQERRVEPGGTLEAAVEDLSASGKSAVQPRVGVDSQGAATVVWTRFDGAGWIVQGRRLGAAGAPQGGMQDLSPAGGNAAEPQLAVAPGGAATVAWTRFDGGGSIVQARRLDAAGAPAGAAVTLSAPGDAADPRLALAPDGTATVLWSRSDGSSWVVQRRDLSAAGGLGATQTLSAAGRSAGDPVGAWGGDGTLAIAWRRASGSADVIQAQTFPLVPPPPPPPPPIDPPGGGSAPGLPGSGGSGSGGSAPGGPSAGSSPGAPPGPPGPSVDNSFQVSGITFDRRRGTATLAVVVPGPGAVSLRGSVPRQRQVASAAQVLLRVVPKAAKRRLLKRRGTVRLRVTVTFAPAGGEASSRTLTLRLKRATPRS